LAESEGHISAPVKTKSEPRKPRRKWVRIVIRTLQVVGLLIVVLVLAVTIEGWQAFGKGADGPRRAAMEASPQWLDGAFENTEPLHNDMWLMITGLFSKSDFSVPSAEPPTIPYDQARFAKAPASGLRVTWLGHSTIVIEIDGHRLLTDPVWSDRISPVSWAGPQRWYPPPIPLEALPPIDAVLISHDHYDHLDHPTIMKMAAWDTRFIVPLGVGAHLVYWGVPANRIIELDWWDKTKVRDLEIVCTPARHASGRTLFDTNATLWAGYALIGASHRAYFSGDTGLFPALDDIGKRLGPFDVTMIESGAYGSGWPDWHLGPEQAVRAHRMVRGKLMIPIHWGLFDLAYHAWTEPAERVLAAAESVGVSVSVPKPGQSIEPASPPALERWWPNVPWKTGAEDPIVATRMPPEAR
jgi:L-ascorbate metabolism protein UlaG (beta-lactamase superfamily)